MREDGDGGALLEPIRAIQIDLDDAFVGEAVNAGAGRRTELVELRPSRQDKSRARFHGQSRVLIDFNSKQLLRRHSNGAHLDQALPRLHAEYRPIRSMRTR